MLEIESGQSLEEVIYSPGLGWIYGVPKKGFKYKNIHISARCTVEYVSNTISDISKGFIKKEYAHVLRSPTSMFSKPTSA